MWAATAAVLLLAAAGAGLWVRSDQGAPPSEQALTPATASGTPAAAAYNHARQYDEAIAECEPIVDIDPNFYFTYWCLGFAYWQKGMLEEAIAAYERGIELEPGDLHLKADLAIVYADAGQKAQAQNMRKEFEEKARREYVPPYVLAMGHMAVGDLDGTFAWLVKMYEEHAPVLIYMNEHPRYDRLRGDPRFQELLRKIGFRELKFIPATTSE
jgi:tetratricopeptide (TPR) repeat protein